MYFPSSWKNVESLGIAGSAELSLYPGRSMATKGTPICSENLLADISGVASKYLELYVAPCTATINGRYWRVLLVPFRGMQARPDNSAPLDSVSKKDSILKDWLQQ